MFVTSGVVVGGVFGVLCFDSLAIVEFGGAAALWEKFFDHV